VGARVGLPKSTGDLLPTCVNDEGANREEGKWDQEETPDDIILEIGGR